MRLPLALCLLAALEAPAVALEAPPAALEAPPAVAPRLELLKGLLSEAPVIPDGYLHADFLKAVPPDKLIFVLKSFYEDVGTITHLELTEVVSDYKVKLQVFTAKDKIFPCVLGVAGAPPHEVNALWFGAPMPALKTVAEAVDQVKALGEGASLSLFQILDDGQLKPLARLNGEAQRAIGSTFKLYILGALIEAVEAGRQGWSDLVPLQAARRSWPSGMLHDWPQGSPVTLQTLASLMISISDNTATDHLLWRLGREVVEAQMARMGAAEPQRTQPFLSTREMFLLKTRTHQDTHLKAYLAAPDAAARRAYIEGPLAALEREAVKIDLGEITAIETVEWFASTDDLCRAMAWIKARVAGAGVPARAILGINPGVKFEEADWAYVGYKGGSEPGVLNGTWLLQRKRDGAWFALSVSWNDPKSAVKLEDLFAPARGLIRALGRGLE